MRAEHALGLHGSDLEQQRVLVGEIMIKFLLLAPLASMTSSRPSDRTPLHGEISRRRDNPFARCRPPRARARRLFLRSSHAGNQVQLDLTVQFRIASDTGTIRSTKELIMSLLRNGETLPRLSIAKIGGGMLNLPDDLAGSFGVVLIIAGPGAPIATPNSRASNGRAPNLPNSVLKLRPSRRRRDDDARARRETRASLPCRFRR